MLKEILTIIINFLTIVGWVALIRMFWIVPDRINGLNEALKEVYNGVVLLLWKQGLLKPLEEDKVIDPKTGKVSLIFNVKLLKKLDAQWEEKEKKGEKKSA